MDLHAKTVGAAERDEEARARWRGRVAKLVAKLDPGGLVFVNECGSNVGLSSLRARAQRGERAFGSAPRNRGKKNTPLLASMTREGMGPCVAVEGASTAKVFEAYYVEQALAPELRLGQVVVLENLNAHKGEWVRELVEARGCEVLFLPAYSPDYPPIEEAFRGGQDAAEEGEGPHQGGPLLKAIGRALDAVSGRDARGWFAHCGYSLRGQLP